MTDIEALRLANVRNKEKLLAELKLSSTKIVPSKAQVVDRDNGPATKKRRVDLRQAPTRSSVRLQQGGERPSYREEPENIALPRRVKGKSDKQPEVIPVKVKLEAAPNVNMIRDNWTKWTPSGAAPIREESGTFHFKDYPLFQPNKSPEEMIREGSFGGSYWRPLTSTRLGIVIQDDWKELPASWTKGLDTNRYLTNPIYDAEVNKYKVACGQSIEEWEASGWIMHEYDVRGWFQWYCRFFEGRRCDDDDRQVSRWRKCVGPTGRWKRMLLKAYLKMGVRDVFDDGEDEEGKEVSPVMHQTCHHWACEIKQHDLDGAWNESK